MAFNISTLEPIVNITTFYPPAAYIPPVWPLWVEATIPIVCILLFVVTLVVIFYKPSKPGDEPLFYIPLTKCKHEKNTRDTEEELRANNASDGDDASNRNVVVV
ncbi:hypothetical protein LSH36_785g03095 [Paralvinella palmiformis]|uniref:Uncharacterized protein n=1 Tax=Paralvinella palmiformis TaxID=53620 RepID=A0AAD9MU15_9ANNE|nr:hypothetical protein LSH36_785g03095 [Paralvinella palmiformis]